MSAAPAAASRFTLRSMETPAGGFATDVRRGLTAPQKSIPPQYFYDDLGSALFAAICELPEYYVTRAERNVLTTHGREIAAALRGAARVVELGAGNASKTRLLLDALAMPLEYVPVDVDSALLERVGRELAYDYPELRVAAVRADFRRPSRAIHAVGSVPGRTAVLFLGSTIGNLDHDAAVTMLRDLRSALAPGDVLLLGADLRKPKEILEPAYDDALGVTAAFNRNLLQRINRELGGHFDPRAFAHRAFYDEERARIEMHLVSLRDQSVRIDALELEVPFAEGETIHTESSHKYDEASIAAMASAAGFMIERRWCDAREYFADVLFSVR